MSLKMRVGLGQFNEISDELLAFIKQLGADDFLMNTPKLPGAAQWEYEDLAAIKAKADEESSPPLNIIPYLSSGLSLVSMAFW